MDVVVWGFVAVRAIGRIGELLFRWSIAVMIWTFALRAGDAERIEYAKILAGIASLPPDRGVASLLRGRTPEDRPERPDRSAA